MPPPPRSHAFITFEGGEGAGKTTQLARLQRRLEEAGCKVVATREPGGTPVGARVREMLLHGLDESQRLSSLGEALLYSLDRAEHLEQIVRPALQAGKYVLCDRFADSTLAYQGHAAAGEQAKIEALNRLVVGETWPDLTFILDVPVPAALARARARSQKASWYDQREAAFHETLRQAFRQIAADNPSRCALIEADAGVEQVGRQIEQICRRRLGVSFP